jgi:beta-lactamase class A
MLRNSLARLGIAVALILSALFLAALASAQTSPPPAEKQSVLWMKLEKSILDVDRNLDGVMGVAIVDLTDGHKYLLHANDIFPQASSIKICVLAELYRQAQQGKLKLTDLYTVNAADLVQDSDIMGGLTPGVTQITLRDLATMMVAVSDNSATNVLIDRVGMDNVNAFLSARPARYQASPQDDGPQGRRRRPRKCLHAQRDGDPAQGALQRRDPEQRDDR